MLYNCKLEYYTYTHDFMYDSFMQTFYIESKSFKNINKDTLYISEYTHKEIENMFNGISIPEKQVDEQAEYDSLIKQINHYHDCITSLKLFKVKHNTTSNILYNETTKFQKFSKNNRWTFL